MLVFLILDLPVTEPSSQLGRIHPHSTNPGLPHMEPAACLLGWSAPSRLGRLT